LLVGYGLAGSRVINHIRRIYRAVTPSSTLLEIPRGFSQGVHTRHACGQRQVTFVYTSTSNVYVDRACEDITRFSNSWFIHKLADSGHDPPFGIGIALEVLGVRLMHAHEDRDAKKRGDLWCI